MTIVNPTALPSATVSGGVGGSGGGAAPAVNNTPISDGAGGWAWSPALKLQSTTGAGGFALQNGTPNILTYMAPNDGQLHRVAIYAQKQVTNGETGGAVGLTINLSGINVPVFAGGLAAGQFIPSVASTTIMTLQPGDVIKLVQTSALTAGASKVFAEIWGS